MSEFLLRFKKKCLPVLLVSGPLVVVVEAVVAGLAVEDGLVEVVFLVGFI